MVSAARFIHGFRRENLAIEIVETPKPRRAELTRELLSDPARRPAIVYAPSRKEAESLAAELSPLFPTAAYHAGLDAQHRDRVQQAFLGGELQAVVATIAFGMGIDKADVRTVIHTAMPATLEPFYQEIGRAGRDGKPSRTVLMYSWADRRLLEFFLERDYPSVETLRDILRRIPAQGLHKDELRESLRMDAETFERALEKLAVHGGVNVDYSDRCDRRRRRVGRCICSADLSQAGADRPGNAVCRAGASAGWRRWCVTSATAKMGAGPAGNAISVRRNNALRSSFACPVPLSKRRWLVRLRR